MICQFCGKVVCGSTARKKYCSKTRANRGYHAEYRGKVGGIYTPEASEERLAQREAKKGLKKQATAKKRWR